MITNVTTLLAWLNIEDILHCNLTTAFFVDL